MPLRSNHGKRLLEIFFGTFSSEVIGRLETIMLIHTKHQLSVIILFSTVFATAFLYFPKLYSYAFYLSITLLAFSVFFSFLLPINLIATIPQSLAWLCNSYLCCRGEIIRQVNKVFIAPKKNEKRTELCLSVFVWLRGFCPLIRGKQTLVCEGFAVSGEEGIFSCFLQSNIRASPTYALQKSSVTAKTVGVYRFLTLLQIPLNILLNAKRKTPIKR